MGSIANDWKHLLTTETSQKSLFLLNNKVTSKVKDFQKLSKEEIYFILPSNSAKYNKLFKFISWPNILEEHHILSRDIWGKTFADRPARKVSKYGVTSGPYFPAFSLDTGKYGPEITPYWDTFHAVSV